MSPPSVLERDLSSALKYGDRVLALVAGFPTEQRVVAVRPDDLYPNDPEHWFATRHAEPVGLMVWRDGQMKVLIRHEFHGQAWVENGLKHLTDDFMKHMAKEGFPGTPI